MKTALKGEELLMTQIKSKDIHYSGKAGDEVWFRVLEIKEEGQKKVKYNRNQNATNDVGCNLRG